MFAGDEYPPVPQQTFFAVHLTGSVKTAGTWFYDWTQQYFDGATGSFNDADSPATGTKTAGPFMVEVNNLQVTTPCYAWARQRGDVAGEAYYEFYAGSTSSSVFGLTPQTPAALSASQNDYNPGAGTLFELTATVGVNITGWLAPPQDGQLLIVKNVGNFAITLTHQDAASLAADRWWLPYAQSLVLTPLATPGGAIFVYQNALPGWLCLSFTPPAASGTVEGVITTAAQTIAGLKTFNAAQINITSGAGGETTAVSLKPASSSAWPGAVRADDGTSLLAYVGLELDKFSSTDFYALSVTSPQTNAQSNTTGILQWKTSSATVSGFTFRINNNGVISDGFTGTGGGGDTFLGGVCTAQGSGPALIAGVGIGISGNTISSPGAELAQYYNNF